MKDRVEIDLPYIHRYRDRHGRERLYYRRKAFPTVALPPHDSEAFLDAYQRAGIPPDGVKVRDRPGPKPGTFGALCHAYLSSADYLQLADTTRREMGYVIAKLIEDHGDKRLDHLERRHILGWKDRLAKKPGAANKLLRTVKRLLAFGQDRGLRADNPAQGITMMRLGRYRAWTDAELDAFEQRWPVGTLERTGYALALYTGQRRADVAKLKWSSIAGGVLKLKQGKTGTDVSIPLHPALKDALAAVHPRHEGAILTGATKKPLSTVYFGKRMADAIAAAGLPDDCVLHGLRKTTGRLLAEAGAKVAPITGHRSERMAAEYSRDAEQATLARAAVLKWAAKGRRTKRESG